MINYDGAAFNHLSDFLCFEYICVYFSPDQNNTNLAS